jgi:hypothetical protein
VRENSNQQWLINSECGGCRILRLHTNNHRTTVTMASDGTDHHGR